MPEPAFHALMTNLIWNNTRLGAHRIECNLSPLGLIWITVSNFVLAVLTLGIFIPWAMVRLTRFQVESVWVTHGNHGMQLLLQSSWSRKLMTTGRRSW
jgi:uncharacterized membrane protein YjgN (DUF898 family)